MPAANILASHRRLFQMEVTANVGICFGIAKIMARKNALSFDFE